MFEQLYSLINSESKSFSLQKMGIAARKVKHCVEVIVSDEYAAWRAEHKPPRLNERRARRLKNQPWKKFAASRGIKGRVKTHDLNDPSMIAWKVFQKAWARRKQEIIGKYA